LNTANVAKLSAFPFELEGNNPLLRLEKAFMEQQNHFIIPEGLKVPIQNEANSIITFKIFCSFGF